MSSLYVDDVVTGASDEDKAYALYENSKKILKEGGFNLRKFCTNSTSLQMRIDGEEASASQCSTIPCTGEAEETYSCSTLCPTQGTRSGERKVLGIRWDVSTDQIVMSLEDIASLARKLDPTKRTIVSLVGKFYDPMGLLSPVVITFKIFLQELCEAKLGWDQPLTGRLLEKWHCLSSSLQEIQTLCTPRCFHEGVGDQDVSYSLCGFCDSSLKAYAAVIYLVIETPDGRHTRFVASKTRVSPLKAQTIPRLELLSALLLSRLIASVTQALEVELPLSEPHCFTDSMVALFWIQGVEKIWKAFVQNRVSEIRELLPPSCWAHCSGRDNPADLPSRGLKPRELVSSQLWRNGPDWLKRIEPSYEDVEDQMPEECKTEMKVEVSHGLLVKTTGLGIGQLLKCEDFNSFRRLTAVTAIVLKFCRILLKCIRPEPGTCIHDDQARAEVLWLVESQEELMKDKSFNLWSNQFNLFQDDNKVWRCGGRIQNADVPFATKHPALLSPHHRLTTLLVKRAHERVMHSGVKATLTELRSQFWILKGRSVVKGILRKCTVCRRFEGKPYCAPPPPPLPPFRLEEAPPFTHTGVDFAGPLYVRQPDGTSHKTWICLYTCCVIRAIHLDLVPDLSTAAFIRSFKRFASRRGLPAKMVSDNGKTFKAAARIIESVMAHGEVQQHLAHSGVRWIFNLPKAPWWGGMFERLIGSTKRCLRKVIGQAKLSYDELLTAVVEAEAVINSRPLTYVSMDDLDEPLTPAHLLIGRRVLSLPDYINGGCEDVDEAEPELLGKRARHLNATLNQFWQRWRKEYLLELRESHRYHHGHTNPSQVSVDDVVVVHSTEQPRAFWKLGRIKEVLVGKDGQTRGALLRVAGGGRKSTLLQRPIQLLYPLEVPHSHQKTGCEIGTKTMDPAVSRVQAEHSPEHAQDPNNAHESTISQHPKRAAATQARDRLMAQALSED